jgi:hypothetical protein
MLNCWFSGKKNPFSLRYYVILVCGKRSFHARVRDVETTPTSSKEGENRLVTPWPFKKKKKEKDKPPALLLPAHTRVRPTLME